MKNQLITVICGLVIYLSLYSNAEDTTVCTRYESYQSDEKQCVGKTIFVHGNPGVEGEKGNTGEPGSTGKKGEKGASGDVFDESNRKLLRCEIASYLHRIRDWFYPGNGYQYKATTLQLTWEAGRRKCKEEHADLAIFGVKDYNIRGCIARSLNLNDTWIGLRKEKDSNHFVWLDGSNDFIHWQVNEPNNAKKNEDCGGIQKYSGFKTYDYTCETNLVALCEKSI